MKSTVDQAAEPTGTGPPLVNREQEDVGVNVGFDVLEPVRPVLLGAVVGVDKVNSECASAYHIVLSVSCALD